MAKRRARPSPSKKSKGRRDNRRDGWANEKSGHGTTRDRRTFTTNTVEVVRDRQAIDLWRSDDILANIIELLPQDATRRGISLTVGTDEGGNELADAIMKDLRRLDLMQKIKEVGQKQRALGGGALFPVLTGAVGDLDEPLDEESGYLNRIEKIAAIHVLEPRELIPIEWYDSITDPGFRHPKLYQLTPLSGSPASGAMMQMVHESRLIIFRGIRITNQRLPGQRPGWGDSVLNRVRQVAADFGLAWGSAATLLHEFALGVLNLDGLDELLTSKAGEALVQKKLETLHMSMSTIRARVLGKNDTFTRQASTVTGLADMMVQLAQRVAAAAGIPVTKLFGMSPAGQNATGEYDTKGWDDKVDDEQAEYDKPVEHIIKLSFLQIDGPAEGQLPDVWSYEWNPLRQQTDEEISNQRKIDSEADLNWYNTGALTSNDIATHWKGESYKRDITVDWKARAAQEKLDQQLQQKQLDAAAMAAMGRTPPQPGAAPAPNGAPKNGVPAPAGAPAVAPAPPAAKNQREG